MGGGHRGDGGDLTDGQRLGQMGLDKVDRPSEPCVPNGGDGSQSAFVPARGKQNPDHLQERAIQHEVDRRTGRGSGVSI